MWRVDIFGRWLKQLGRSGPGLVLFGLLLVQVLIPLIAEQPSVGYDGEQYLVYAKNILDLHRFTFDGATPSSGRPPGYPVFLMAFLFLFGGVSLVYPFQLVLLFVSYLAVAWTLREALPLWWRIALVALLVGCQPINKLGMTIQTEALFIFLAASGLLFLCRFLRRSSLLDLIVFSILATLSAYVRPVTMLFAFFATAALLFARRIRLGNALIIILISAGLIAPWTYRNWRTFGKSIPLASNYGSIYYMTDQQAFTAIMFRGASASHALVDYDEIVGQDFELDLPANDRYLTRAKENIAKDPLGFIKRCSLKTLFVWSYLPLTRTWLEEHRALFFLGVAVQWSFLSSAVWGAFLLRRKFPWLVWPGALFAVYHVFALFPFYAESRFLVPVYIVLTGFSAYAVYTLVQSIERRFFSAQRATNS